MLAERPPIRDTDVEQALQEPDSDHGRRAARWVGGRTIIVYYQEEEGEIVVLSVSATTGRLSA